MHYVKRMKRAFEDKTPLIHKVPCRHCGYYNNPVRLHKLERDTYYRCIKCGKELKTEKQDFIDRLTLLLKGGS